MNQDYRALSPDELEAIEKQTLRTLVQAMQDYSREARQIFETTPAASDGEVIVLAEDLVQYALEVAECYPINRRFAGFIDYKRVRWLATPYGMFPQVLLVDAKASTESNRETLQRSQLPMDAEFESRNQVVRLSAGVPPHMPLLVSDGSEVPALTTSAFIHFFYEGVVASHPVTPNAAYELERTSGQTIHRKLKAIFLMALPHQTLKPRYNPSAGTTFFGQGKHSPARHEEPRIRVYFTRLKKMCPWRLQELWFRGDANGYAEPLWRDADGLSGKETLTTFRFIGR
jgi:hypothetical protein